MYQDLTAADLETRKTLAVGQHEDLKIDDGHHRVWLDRTPGSRTISVEQLRDGRWVVIDTYEG